MGINLQPLDNSGYVLQSQNERLGRTIFRYLLEDSEAAPAVQAAIQALTNLVQQNPNLVPVYSQENLAQRVKYLIINGNAISLSSEPRAPAEFVRKTTDAYFSEAPLKEPVTCERGHSFELVHIQSWVAIKGDICPYQENHPIGDIVIDEEILDDVQRARYAYGRFQAAIREAIEARAAAQAAEARVQEANNRVQAAEARVQEADNRAQAAEARVQNANNRARAAATRAQNANNRAEAAEARALVGRSVCSVSTQIVTFKEQKAKNYLTIAVKCSETYAIHSLAKKVPILSVFLGLVMGGIRLAKGDKPQKAVAEVMSGVAACFPGLGTAASLALDGGLLATDCYEQYSLGTANNEALTAAKNILQLNAAKPSKEDIDRAHRRIIQSIHPDVNRLNQRTSAQFDELTRALNEVKNFLYLQYGY